jgi:hypothetical protein
MSESPIERLNYYDGQRLQARDFKVEQDFHIRIQRWLTKSLFTPGIADGLEVTVPDGNPPWSSVVIQPGLAIDDLGRAIILVEANPLQVRGRFLTIRYDEQKAAPQQDGCGTAQEGGKPFAWGGPSRIVSTPLFSWRAAIPRDNTRELVLAEFELDDQCHVQRIIVTSRRYAGAAQTSRVNGFALEGEKDITGEPEPISKTLRFHIRGRRPDAVILYLRGDRFSPTHYTELGHHSHGGSVTAQQAHTDPASGVDDHSHLIPGTGGGSHTHEIHGNVSVMDNPNPVLPPANPGPSNPPYSIMAVRANGVAGCIFVPPPAPDYLDGTHVQNNPDAQLDSPTAGIGLRVLPAPDVSLPANTLGPLNPPPPPTHFHTFTAAIASSIDFAGATGIEAVEKQPVLDYFDGLRVIIDGQDVTDAILEQVVAEHPDQLWKNRLGDGSADHPMVTSGTQAIRLDHIDKLDLGEGEHVIEMKVFFFRNGGRVIYNLYVE